MTKIRPTSIVWFERLFVASILLSVVRASINWIENFTSGDFNLEGWTNFTTMMMLATLISFTIEIGLWYFIARRASNIAKWVLIAKTSLGLAVISWTLTPLLQSNLATLIGFTLFIHLFIILSIVFLFRRDARGWFREKDTIREDTTDLAEKFR